MQILVASQSDEEYNSNQLYYVTAEVKALNFPQLYKMTQWKYNAYNASQMSSACTCVGVGCNMSPYVS